MIARAGDGGRRRRAGGAARWRLRCSVAVSCGRIDMSRTVDARVSVAFGASVWLGKGTGAFKGSRGEAWTWWIKRGGLLTDDGHGGGGDDANGIPCHGLDWGAWGFPLA